MTIDQIIATATSIGSDLPAYKQLFDLVVASHSETDQVKLRASYADALAAADQAHAQAQSL